MGKEPKNKNLKPIIVAVVAIVAAVAGYFGIDISPEIQAPAVDAVCAIAGSC